MKLGLFLSIAAAASVLASAAFAGKIGPVVPSKEWRWVGSVRAGSVWATGGETQTFFLTPDIEKSYRASKSTNALPSGELFVGMQKSLTSQWIGQLGLAAAITGNAKIEGIIWDDADPQFDN